MNKNLLTRAASAALVLTLGAPWALADDLEFHGYIRSGAALNQDLLNASKDNGHSGISSNLIGRLGNEDDTWVESELVKKITADDGAWTKLHIGASYSSTEMANPLKTAEVGSAYVEVGGFDFDPQAVFFVGKKPNREDIHIMDLKWRNFDGAGFGVAGALGGNLDVSVLTSGNTTFAAAVPLNLDLRYKVLSNLQLEAGASYAKDGTKATGDATLSDHGFQGAVVYYWDKFYGLPIGWMTLAAQAGYGMNGAGGSNWNALGSLGNVWTKQDSAAFRLVTSGTGSVGAFDVAAGLWGEYDLHGPNGTKPYLVAASAVRPVWKITKYVSLVGEAGASVQQDRTIADAALVSYKFTLAPTLALDSGVGARPQLRLFVSYVGQDERLGKISTDGTQDHEVKFGVQTEVWW
jgi:maltoporin